MYYRIDLNNRIIITNGNRTYLPMNLSVISITANAFFFMRGGDLGITGRGRRNRRGLRGGRRHAGSLFFVKKIPKIQM